MQRALRQTVNWFMYSNEPFPNKWQKSALHLVVKALLENRNPMEVSNGISAASAPFIESQR
jgi:hypothetical protein